VLWARARLKILGAIIKRWIGCLDLKTRVPNILAGRAGEGDELRFIAL
jgi:hypothetical protein